MSSVHEMSRVDRELSSELIESPINPAFLHMSVFGTKATIANIIK